jgi:hypothetical protein
VPCLLRDLHPTDGEERQAQSIGDEEGTARCDPEPQIAKRYPGRRQDHPQVSGIGDPEDRVAIKEHVAQRPAPIAVTTAITATPSRSRLCVRRPARR